MHLALSQKAYSGCAAVSIVRPDRNLRSAPVDPAASPAISQAIFFQPFPGWKLSKQKFPGFGAIVENSFPNGWLSGSSCIVLGRDDLLERPHETLVQKRSFEPGAKGSMI
ncbi:hypothetical protein FJ527_19030 [Mesorhizobium sp. B2-4-18]|uniref:hypothetical protein n=1 Tax=Mesorhizobium sp. B2-4-18 TaxID=2589931 RepID=UPI00112D0CA9|nr:hypothetical protein [Mesorhizobium sp. B2-4-18]TPK75198.1 hypothetical protein FJ527_19030 [Mesorhizobium sp. B2-4-18]